MRVHLIKKQTIEDYVVKNPNSRKGFEFFLAAIKGADWKSPNQIKETFNSADVLGKNCNRIVFNISGNNYRVICKYLFGNKKVYLFVCWIGTHAEYSKLCDKELQYSVSKY